MFSKRTFMETLRIIIVCETYIVIISQACDESNSISVDNLITRGQALEGAAFWVGTMEEITDCAVGCVRRKMCKTFNYDMLLKWCELNYGLHSHISFRLGTESLIYSNISRWPTKLDPSCSSRPCTDNQVCLPNPVAPPSSGQCSYICIDLTIFQSQCFDQSKCDVIGGTCQGGLCLCPGGKYDGMLKQCVFVCEGDLSAMYPNAVFEPGTGVERMFTCGNNYVQTVPTLLCRVDPVTETTSWYPSSDICVELHGSSCEADVTCSAIDAVCTDAKCQCANNMYYSQGDTMCNRKFKLEIGSIGGNGVNTGVLRMYHSAEWRYVSIEDWNWKGTLAVCQDINPAYVFGGSYHESTVYGQGTTSNLVKFKSLDCGDPIKTSLLECTYTEEMKTDHNKDLGITCYTSDITGNIRLNSAVTKNGPGTEHRLEVKYNGVWGTVCKDKFDGAGQDTACRTIDPSNPKKDKKCDNSCAGTSPAIPNIVEGVDCDGDETHLFYCKNLGWENHSCPGDEIGLLCKP